MSVCLTGEQDNNQAEGTKLVPNCSEQGLHQERDEPLFPKHLFISHLGKIRD